MKNIKFVVLLILILILAGGYFLRLHNYAEIPYPGESMDEYSFSWVGFSLIQVGVPIGVSGIPGYKTYDYRYINVDHVFQETAKGNAFSINTPWFDHPPLIGLLTGGFAYIKGAQVFEDLQTSLIRKPMLFIGVLSILLLFIYLKALFGYLEALVGSIIYATSPLAIISSRMVQAENLLIPLFLISLILLFYYQKKGTLIYLWLAAGFAGVSLLVKFSGIAIILSCIFLLFCAKGTFKKHFLDSLTFGIVSLSFLLLFIGYAAVYDFEQFLAILSSNGNRFYGIGAVAFHDLLTSTRITSTRYLTDGWLLSGWIAVFMLFFKSAPAKQSSENFILVPVFGYLVVFLLFGSESYGWYRFPFLPFLFAATACIIASAFRTYGNYLAAGLLLLIPLGISISKIIFIVEFQKYAFYWRWGLSSLIVLFMIFGFLKITSRRINYLPQFILISFFAFTVIINLEYFFKITTDYWRSAG